jgi:hypothetical protein
MPTLTSAIMLRASGLLNDYGQETYNNVNLLTHLQNAWLRLETEFLLNDLPIVEEATATLEIAADAIGLTAATVPILPIDLIVPYSIWIKGDDDTVDAFYEITEVGNLPNRIPNIDLPTEWVFREGNIYWVACTTTFDMLLKYEKHMTRITTSGDNIYIMEAELYLAAQTASFAALIMGGNAELSGSLQGMADDQLKKIIANRVKATQNLPARRKAYGYYRRARRMR